MVKFTVPGRALVLRGGSRWLLGKKASLSVASHSLQGLLALRCEGPPPREQAGAGGEL